MNQKSCIFSQHQVALHKDGKLSMVLMKMKMADGSLPSDIENEGSIAYHLDGSYDKIMDFTKTYPCWKELKAPYSIGQRVWIREDWNISSDGEVYFRTDGINGLPLLHRTNISSNQYAFEDFTWKSSASMPTKYAIRSFEVTGRKAIRLRDLTEEDCVGMTRFNNDWIYDKFPEYAADYSAWKSLNDPSLKPPLGISPLRRYVAYYESLHGAGSWAADQDVWFWSFNIKG